MNLPLFLLGLFLAIFATALISKKGKHFSAAQVVIIWILGALSGWYAFGHYPDSFPEVLLFPYAVTLFSCYLWNDGRLIHWVRFYWWEPVKRRITRRKDRQRQHLRLVVGGKNVPPRD